MSNGKWWEGDEVHMDEGERVREAKTGKDGKINHKLSAYPFNKFESLQWPIPQIFRPINRPVRYIGCRSFYNSKIRTEQIKCVLFHPKLPPKRKIFFFFFN